MKIFRTHLIGVIRTVFVPVVLFLLLHRSGAECVVAPWRRELAVQHAAPLGAEIRPGSDIDVIGDGVLRPDSLDYEPDVVVGSLT